MHVAVHEHGPLVVVGGDPTLGAGHRMLDGGRSEHGRSSASHVVVMVSISHRPFSAPVGRPQPGAGRHTRDAVATRIAWRRPSGRPSATRATEALQQQRTPCQVLAQQRDAPSPSARRSTVISWPAASMSRGTSSLSTAGVPSSVVAAATNASVAS